MKVLFIRCSDSEFEKIQDIAKSEEMTVNSLMREVIRKIPRPKQQKSAA